MPTKWRNDDGLRGAACGFRDGCIRYRHFCAFIFRLLPQTAGRDGKSLIVVGKRESRALNVGDARKCVERLKFETVLRDGTLLSINFKASRIENKNRAFIKVRNELSWKNLIANCPISFCGKCRDACVVFLWLRWVGGEEREQVGKQGRRYWKRKKRWLHGPRGWEGQNGRQPIGCRDKMAVGEFNQYLPPSFVVGGGQDKTQKGPGT
ncbi:uncharacterized protein LOC116849428 [Odontomachus brunneus]|uniref:uncharacterized protein LOC116849428 n=1 Tax=Odontomachus brunneus TaxID=486640 RepID=UPI0013F208AF|nr:uncharacterized protein LOC116849428 [Odontomachus brunneus]